MSKVVVACSYSECEWNSDEICFKDNIHIEKDSYHTDFGDAVIAVCRSREGEEGTINDEGE